MENLHNLIKLGESKTLEFKKSIAGLEAAGKNLCAFLNQLEGGTLIIGVSDSGKIIGQQFNDSVSKKIAAFLNRFQPAGRIDINYIDLDNSDKKVIILKAVPLSNEQPYSYDGKYYERLESTTQQLSHDRIRYLYLESSDAAKIWGEQTSISYKLDDLDSNEIRKAVKQGVNTNRLDAKVQQEDMTSILNSLKLMDNGLLTHSAMVLFAKNTQRFLPQCKIQMGRFRGSDKYGEILDSKMFFGNAFQILEEAENFIRKHHFIASRFEESSFERIDEPTLPVFAVREALINAICHRNYREIGAAIYLAIYDDKTEIWNSGFLPQGWDLDKLKQKHKSDPRNELVANVFYLRKFIERWGMGIQKIFDECKKANVPMPEYSEYSNGVAITFKYREPLAPIKVKTTDKKIMLSNRQKELLDILSTQRQMAMRDILASLSHPVADRTLRRDLSHLKELGLVSHTGQGRNLMWRAADYKKRQK